MSIWKLLSAIDVNDHVKDKGGYSYLAWTWAWAKVKEHYADANYRLLEDKVYSDGSMEVRCEVTIDGMTHPMWLPVTDHRNKAIQNPNAFDINTARMRCLVKCLAMFGLGHYIYAGESLPQAPSLSDDVRDELLRMMAEKNHMGFTKAYRSLSEAHVEQFFGSFGKGHVSKQKQIVRELLAQHDDIISAYVTGIEGCVAQDDAHGLKEFVDELDDHTKPEVWKRLADMDKAKVKEMLR